MAPNLSVMVVFYNGENVRNFTNVVLQIYYLFIFLKKYKKILVVSLAKDITFSLAKRLVNDDIDISTIHGNWRQPLFHHYRARQSL
jgi:hypothetical protein